ncbi:glutaredoxin [Acidovorax sp. IB03]|nr:glutaredoxin [Acidovorax sp. IB03]
MPLDQPAQAIGSPAYTRPRRRLNLAPMTLKITVYSKSACPQCESAKSLLKARSLPYEEIKIDDEAERLAFYAKCGPAVRQMPQVFINDQRVGGLTGLQAALQQLGL